MFGLVEIALYHLVNVPFLERYSKSSDCFSNQQLCLEESQSLTDAHSLTGAEGNEHVLGLNGLATVGPTVGIEVHWLFEVLLVVKVAEPVEHDHGVLLDGEVAELMVAYRHSREDGKHEAVMPIGFVDDAIQVRQLDERIHRKFLLRNLLTQLFLHLRVDSYVVEAQGHQVRSGVHAANEEREELVDELFGGYVQFLLPVEVAFVDGHLHEVGVVRVFFLAILLN